MVVSQEVFGVGGDHWSLWRDPCDHTLITRIHGPTGPAGAAGADVPDGAEAERDRAVGDLTTACMLDRLS